MHDMTEDMTDDALKASADAARLTCACFALRQAARQITRLYEAEMAHLGLSAGQFSILTALVLHDEATFTDLATGLGMDRTSLSRALRPLERSGFVTLSPEGRKRRRTAKIAPAGRQKYAEAFPFWQRAQAKAARQFGQRDWPALAGQLSDLVETHT